EEAVSSFPDGAVRLVTYPENRGKGYAIRRGVEEARGEVIFFTDCDLAYGCRVIPEFYEILAAADAPDVAVGSRDLHPEGYDGYTLLRKLVSRAYLFVLRLFGGLRLSDSQCGCKGFRADTGKRIFSYCEVDRFAFDLEAILIGQKMGATFCEVPVKVLRHGESKVRIVRDTLRMLRDLRKMKKRIKGLNLDEVTK
ncbi:MAG: glycosyltransferase, partial [Clostridia bacterium]|nr:glycosyltransferase [Clostridia bacterium]